MQCFLYEVVNMKILAYHTHTVITDYTLGDNESFEKMLSVWDDTKFKFKPIGYDYDEESKELIVPRGCNLNTLEHIFNAQSEVIYVPDPYDEISMRVMTPPRNDDQKHGIAFLIGEGEYLYTKKYSQLLLNFETGAGKTYITSAAMQFFRMKTLIVTHTNNIKEQWIDTFLTKTDLSASDICIIKDSATIKRILKNKKSRIFKVYLVTHSTLASYAKHNGWDAVHELFIYLRIGLKIIDEAHRMFANMMKIDFHTNCKKNIYLTATFNRSDYSENKLFKLCTANIVKYSKDQAKITRKHIQYLSVLYDSNPSLDDKASMFTMRKFNKSRYSQYLGTCDKFFDVLKFIVEYFINKEGKMLILATTIDTCEIIKDIISKIYPSKSISLYHSKIPKDEKEIAFDADIICSTPQSAGTGTDIRGLRVVINTECYSSQVTADQVSGRLREYNEKDYTYYIELVDSGFKSVYNMYERRLPLFKNKCVKTSVINYDNPKPPTF